jgi:hypothetical protein
MFKFLDNTPKSEKKEKHQKKEKLTDNFSKNKEIKEEDSNVEGFSLMSNSLGGAEFMTNKTELFDLEASKEQMKGGLETLVALLPANVENMVKLKNKKEGFENVMEDKKKEGMKNKKEGMKNKKEGMKNKKEGMKNKKEGMKNKKEGMEIMEEEEEEEDEEKEEEVEGMAVMRSMDNNTQIFAGGITVIALLLAFKFMHGKK